jgi:hypothetical protein
MAPAGPVAAAVKDLGAPRECQVPSAACETLPSPSPWCRLDLVAVLTPELVCVAPPLGRSEPTLPRLTPQFEVRPPSDGNAPCAFPLVNYKGPCFTADTPAAQLL